MQAHHQKVGLISVPGGSFVAVASLSLQIKQLSLTLRFRADKTFAADASLSRR